MASTIAVLLSENELIIIQSWINHMRDVNRHGEWSEAENNLAEKIKDQQRFLKHINS
jgi:hypothetical protein